MFWIRFFIFLIKWGGGPITLGCISDGWGRGVLLRVVDTWTPTPRLCVISVWDDLTWEGVQGISVCEEVFDRCYESAWLSLFEIFKAWGDICMLIGSSREVELLS